LSTTQVETGFADGRAWQRGINAMQLDLAKGTVVKRWNFDTCCGGGEIAPDKENARLTAMLNSIPDGTVVVFGIYDEGI